jgi:hypothetical protein
MGIENCELADCWAVGTGYIISDRSAMLKIEALKIRGNALPLKITDVQTKIFDRSVAQ